MLVIQTEALTTTDCCRQSTREVEVAGEAFSFRALRLTVAGSSLTGRYRLPSSGH